MMSDRFSRPKQRSWLLPTIVILGAAGFFLWESGWRPFEVIDVPTGSIAGENPPADETQDLSLPDVIPEQFEPDPTLLTEDELLTDFDAHAAAEEMRTRGVGRQPITPANFDPPAARADSAFDISQFDPNAGSGVRTADAELAKPPATITQPAQPQPAPKTAAPSSSGGGAELASRLNKIRFLLDEDDYLTAHRDLSAIYWYQPQNRDAIDELIQHTATSIFAAPQPHYMKPYVVQSGDTLGKIAQQYNVPWQYLGRLNNLTSSRVREGTKLKVIRGPFNAVIDLSDFELTIHAHGYYVQRFKIGIGKGQTTPIGEFAISNKLENPTYYPTDGGVVSADDPSNPLGEYWLGLGGLGKSYGIHGTTDPNSIGKAESRGCIRLRTPDIEQVFDMLTPGSKVIIRR